MESKRRGRPPRVANDLVKVVAIAKICPEDGVFVLPGQEAEIPRDLAKKYQDVGAIKVVL